MAQSESEHPGDSLRDELCRVLTTERGDGTGVHRDVGYLIRRDTPAVSLVGIEAGGERAVWHFRMAAEWATVGPFGRRDGEESETLARGAETAAALDGVAYAWVHPNYRAEIAH